MTQLLRWYGLHARDLPWRRTRDPYGIWVSEIMLQQTQVKTVIPFWKRWMREFPDIASLAHAPEDRVLKRWEGLGYYRRARNLQAAARLIQTSHGGQFPECHEDILNLPGVGRYTAGAIASMAFNQAAPIVDGNIIRVLTRLYAIAGNPRESRVQARLWTLADTLVSTAAGRRDAAKRRCADFNQAMMELGALICQPRQPACTTCPVKSQCRALATNRVSRYPNLSRKIKVEKQRSLALVAQARGKVLVRRRPDGIVNAGLWEFPSAIVNGAGYGEMSEWLAALGLSPDQLQPLITLNHSITRYRISLEVHRVRMKRSRRVRDGTWLPLSKLQELPFTGAHKKILNALCQRKK